MEVEAGHVGQVYEAAIRKCQIPWERQELTRCGERCFTRQDNGRDGCSEVWQRSGETKVEGVRGNIRRERFGGGDLYNEEASANAFRYGSLGGSQNGEWEIRLRRISL